VVGESGDGCEEVERSPERVTVQDICSSVAADSCRPKFGGTTVPAL